MSLMNGMRAALLYSAVMRPLGIAKKLFSDRLWPPLEIVSRQAGKLAGVATRRFVYQGESSRDQLRALLRFTEMIEVPLGIRGTNEILDDGRARRTIQHCPFADRIRDVPEFCTAVGGCAGKGAVDAIVPGAEFTILHTRSRGDSECEYEYSVPCKGA